MACQFWHYIAKFATSWHTRVDKRKPWLFAEIFHAVKAICSSGPLIIYSLQVIFEDFQFGSFHSCVAAELCLQNWTLQRPEILSNQAFSGLVVDCGFSFSHALPIFDGRLVLDGVQRVDLGGKALTNYMKELVSFR